MGSVRSALARAPLRRAPVAAVDGRVRWVQVVRGVAARSQLVQAPVGGVPLNIVVETYIFRGVNRGKGWAGGGFQRELRRLHCGVNFHSAPQCVIRTSAETNYAMLAAGLSLEPASVAVNMRLCGLPLQ